VGGIPAEKLSWLLRRIDRGMDEVAVIPVFDLEGPLAHTLQRLERGLVPETYGWTEDKTRLAYSYRGERAWVRSIILAAKYYFTDERYPDHAGFTGSTPGEQMVVRKNGAIAENVQWDGLRPYGRIARFTWRNNYRYLTMRLREMLVALEKELGITVHARVFSNYTAIPEKVLFAGSGLASLGKNSVLINQNMGSLFVIGEALTDLEVDFSGTSYDSRHHLPEPDFSICGSCTRCIDTCPTGAIIADGTLDIGRCIQFLSENLLPIPVEIREVWGNRLYGCTTCLDVCPHNEQLEPWAEKHPIGFVGPGDDLITLFNYSAEQWEKRFSDNQLIVRDRLAIIQNALLCLGNLNYEPSPSVLAPYLSHENWLVRLAAVWAVGRQGSGSARRMLGKLLQEEDHPHVLEEIQYFL